MVARLFLLFTITTLVEMFLLVKLAQWTSFGATVLLVLVTGFVGAWLARQQGMRVVAEIRRDLAAGKLPAAALVDGFCVLVAGIFLMTPGLLTDLAGFALLVPALRSGLRATLQQRLQNWMSQGGGQLNVVSFAGGMGGRSPFDGARPFDGASPLGAPPAEGPRRMRRREMASGDVIDVTPD